MNIALDITPISSNSNSQHKVRGVGFYIKNLKNSLTKYLPDNNYQFVDDLNKIDSSTNLLHIPYFDPFFVHLPKFKKYSTIVTIHDLTPLIFPEHFPIGLKGNIKWQIQKHLVKQADAIITDSQSSKKDIVSLLKFNSEKVHVVYLAAGEEFKRSINNQKQKREMLTKYNLPERFVLYVGDVTWNKNLPLLIKAVKKQQIPLVMIGSALSQANYDRTNPWNSDLNMINKEIENVKYIHTLGFVPSQDLVDIYNLATCLVLPSIYEGFGLTVLEAMQCGCPVITTRNGSLPEIAGNAALYINGEDENDIIEGIQKLFSSEKLQKELCLKGLEQARNFSWEKTAKQTMNVYKSVYEATHNSSL